MNRELTDQDVAIFEAELEDNQIREELRAQYFAVDENNVRRMVDPTYARLFRTGLQAALDLQRDSRGLAPEGAAFEAPRQATKQEQAAWEAKYFAKNEKGERLMAIDPKYATQVNALRDRIWGTRRRDPTGRVVS